MQKEVGIDREADIKHINILKVQPESYFIYHANLKKATFDHIKRFMSAYNLALTSQKSISNIAHVCINVVDGIFV